METQIIKGYKALNQDMSSRYGDMKYDIGRQYRLEGELILCENGYHFCENIINTFEFYDIDNSRVFEIEASGDIIKSGIKSCTNNICLTRELPEDEVGRIINENYNNADVNIRCIIARSKYTNNKTLNMLSDDKSPCVKRAVIRNNNTNIAILEKLSNDKDLYVRCVVAKNHNISITILEKLSNDKDFYVRYILCQNAKTNARILEKLSSDDAWEVRYAVAKNLNTNIAILNKLSNDTNADVRYIANESLNKKK